MSDIDSIDIRDESNYDEKKFVLYIDGGPRATLAKKGKTVQLNWQVYGPQYWPEAKILMQGLLELSVLADQLDDGVKNGQEAED